MRPNQRHIRDSYNEFLSSLSPSQRNHLRALLHSPDFEQELSIALGMLTGTAVANWDVRRLNYLVEIGFANDAERGQIIKRRLAELLEADMVIKDAILAALREHDGMR